ncbi:MAG: hypothetical protein IH948_05480 [Bacteroidetes bacterium]|nr:hypothetical protein [Bacteroidota bacterium]
MEFELEDDETEVGLEYAQIDYLFSRYSTAVLGKFLTPFGVFPLKIHPAWINKLTNRPLMYRSGFLPFTNVGAQLTGAYAPPNDSFRLTYALALVNGGVLEIEGEENEEGIIEEVEDIEIISDSVDITDNVGFIGRIGVIPFQNSQYLNGLEIGASWLVEKVKLAEDDLEFGPGLMGLDNSRNHFTFGIDWDYFYKGLELRGEFAQSHLSLPEEISNLEKQWGTYVQGSYRPTTLGIKYLKDTEAVVRYGQRGGDNEEFMRKELGLGLDYWFTSSFVAKAAYFFVFGQEENISNNAFMLQAAYGF